MVHSACRREGRPVSTGRHPDLIEFDKAIAEHEARQLADEIGYGFYVYADGAIVLNPPAETN